MDWRARTLTKYLKTEDLLQNMNIGEDKKITIISFMIVFKFNRFQNK
jgi:hypothetical protein